MYENALEAKGVHFIYNADVQRLWLPAESGRLNTMEGLQVRHLLQQCHSQ